LDSRIGRASRAARRALLAAFCALGTALPARAGSLSPEFPPRAPLRYLEDRVGVRLTPPGAAALRTATSQAGSIDSPALARLAAAAGVAAFEPEFPRPHGARAAGPSADLSAFLIARLAPGAKPDAAVAALRRAADVADAWPIAILPVTALPNDSLFAQSYHLYQASRRDLHALEAWDVYPGDSSVVVAILDTGILPDHPDLGSLSGATHLWINPAERDGAAGVDDDGNGYVDDLWGWDFVAAAPGARADEGEDWRDADNDPSDFAGHGTAVAGLIGAVVDNQIGVTGLVPDVRLMALRIGWSSVESAIGVVSLSYAAQAVDYATRMGADVINCSFETTASPDFDAAVDAALRAGVVVVTASGNNGAYHDLASRPDVISVTATDAADKVQRFSNLGAYVDLAAPGYALPTTTVRHASADSVGARQPTYTTGATGTSFSSALASGAAALLQGDRRRRGLPRYTPAEILLRLSETADDIRDQNPGVSGYGSGRLDLYRALTDPRGSRVVAGTDTVVGPVAAFDMRGPQPKIAYVTSDGMLIVREGLDNSVVLRASLPAPPASGVSVARLGGGHGYAFFAVTRDGHLVGIDEQGATLPGWPVELGATSGDLEPALGDIDGDGRLDVVLGGIGGVVHAWNQFGEELSGFPHAVGDDTADVHVGLSSLDDTSRVEVLAVASSGTVDIVHAGGVSLPGWPRAAAPAAGAPTVIAADALGTPEIVVPAGESVFGFATNGARLWRQYLRGVTGDAVAAADLDGDGMDEILVPLKTLPSVEVLDGYGNVLAPLDWSAVASTPTSAEPLVGTLRDPATLDVAVFVPGVGLLAFDAHGSILTGYPKPGLAGASAAFGDFDGDGNMELFAGSAWNGDLYFYAGAPGSSAVPASGWSSPRGNSARTGSHRFDPTDRGGVADTSRQLLLSRTAIEFGQVLIGTSVQASFHVINATRDSVTLDVSGPGAPFGLEPSTFPLAPGTTGQVTVHFAPDARSAFAADLHIRDRSGRDSLTLRVSGSGVSAPQLAVAVDTLRATLTVGDSSVVPLGLENRGDLPLVVQPALELPSAAAAAPARPLAARRVVLAASTPVTWLETLLRSLGLDVIRVSSVETLTPDTLALASLVIVALDGGWVGADVVGNLANAARAGKAVAVLGGTQYPPFAKAINEQVIANAQTPGWATSRSPGFMLRSPTSALADSLPSEYTWHALEPSYYSLRVADPDAKVIAVNGNGDPALVYKRLGLGSVLIWTATPSDAAWRDPGDLAVIRQVVANAVRVASQWVSIRVDPITIDPHTSRDLDVVFTAEAQNAGTLTGDILLQSNDPLLPNERVPIRLDVVPAAARGASQGGRSP